MTPYYRRHLDDRQLQRRWIDPRLKTLHVEQIRAYLLLKGWKEVPADQPGVVVFEEPVVSAEGPLYQWIPDSEERREYLQATYELVGSVAEIEDRYAGDVLADMLESTAEANGSANGPAKAEKAHSIPQV